MSAPSIYQDLNYQDSNVYSVLEDVPRKQQQPSRNVPTLQEKEEEAKAVQKRTNRVAKDLEKKLRFWRIIAGSLSLLIIFIIILVVAIFFTQSPSCTYCPSNWIYHSGNCYFFSIDSLDWTASRDNCRRMDSQLAVIKNRDEETFIDLTGQGPTWIGLSKAQNGSWIWEDGTLLGDSFWQYGEPNNNGGMENCVEFFTVFYNSSGWNDSQCRLPKRSLCKRPAGVLSA
ncbi:CD209 antigen-like protein C isoform X2 [Lissotriton helveticus]